MSVTRPFRCTCRPFADGRYTGGGRSKYITHSRYDTDPEHFVRAYLLLRKDLLDLFYFIEPADANLGRFFYRIHALLLRCGVEANLKAILNENGYARSGRWDMAHFSKVERTHLLSRYNVKVPNWTGSQRIRQPFKAWPDGQRLDWYEAYNPSKHSRHEEFESATFGDLLDAASGALVLLSAQLETREFSPSDSILLASEGPGDGIETGIGRYFRLASRQICDSNFGMSFTGKA